MPPPAYAVILTHNRPELLDRCVAAIAPQVDHVLVVDNASDPPVFHRETWPDHVRVLHVPDQPPNLSRLWNMAWDLIAAHVTEDAWDVATLCDDAIVPEGWFRLVADGMRERSAAAASTHGIVSTPYPILKVAPDGDIANRMCSWAYVVAGEKGLRVEETLAFWFGDTRLDLLAREAGGMVVLPGPVVINERPNDFLINYPGLGEQAGRDREEFAKLYNGWMPW